VGLLERFPLLEYDPTLEPERPDWLIHTMWMNHKINGIFGQEKSGKSRLIGWLLAALYNPRSSTVLGQTISTIPRKILYLAGEETRADIIGRLKQYTDILGGDANAILPITFQEASGMRLDTATQRKEMEGLLIEGGYDTLIIEPLRRVHAGNENDSTAMSAIHNEWRKWSTTLGITIIVCHHTPKLNEDSDMTRIATWIRGSTDLASILDSAIFVQPTLLCAKNFRRLKLLRAGRFPSQDPLYIDDLGDPIEGGSGFFISKEQG